MERDEPMTNWKRIATAKTKPDHTLVNRLLNMSNYKAAWFWVYRPQIRKAMRQAANEIVRLSHKCNELISEIHDKDAYLDDCEARIQALYAERTVLEEQVKRLREREKWARPARAVTPIDAGNVVAFDSPALEREVANERRQSLAGKQDAIAAAFDIIDASQ